MATIPPFLPKNADDGTTICDASGNIWRFDVDLKAWIFIGGLGDADVVTETEAGLITPVIYDQLRQVQDVKTAGANFGLFKIGPGTKAYWYYLTSSDRMFKFIPEGIDKLRIEVNKARLLARLAKFQCTGTKGEKGETGRQGPDGLLGRGEYERTPIIAGDKLDISTGVEVVIETDISLRLFLDGDETASIELLVPTIESTDGLFEIVTVGDFEIDVDRSVLEFGTTDSRLTGSIYLPSGQSWSDFGVWTYKASQKGRQGSSGGDGVNFLEVSEKQFDDSQLRATHALVNLRKSNNNLFSFAANLFSKSCVQHLGIAPNCDVAAISRIPGLPDQSCESTAAENFFSSLLFAAAEITLADCKDIRTYKYIPDICNIPSLVLPNWKPTGACLNTRNWSQSNYKWWILTEIAAEEDKVDWPDCYGDRKDPAYPWEIMSPGQPVEKCCEEDFFWCPNVQEGPCGVGTSGTGSSASAIAVAPVPQPYDCCECDCPIAFEVMGDGFSFETLGLNSDGDFFDPDGATPIAELTTQTAECDISGNVHTYNYQLLTPPVAVEELSPSASAGADPSCSTSCPPTEVTIEFKIELINPEWCTRDATEVAITAASNDPVAPTFLAGSLCGDPVSLGLCRSTWQVEAAGGFHTFVEAPVQTAEVPQNLAGAGVNDSATITYNVSLAADDDSPIDFVVMVNTNQLWCCLGYRVTATVSKPQTFTPCSYLWAKLRHYECLQIVNWHVEIQFAEEGDVDFNNPLISINSEDDEAFWEYKLTGRTDRLEPCIHTEIYEPEPNPRVCAYWKCNEPSGTSPYIDSVGGFSVSAAGTPQTSAVGITADGLARGSVGDIPGTSYEDECLSIQKGGTVWAWYKHVGDMEDSSNIPIGKDQEWYIQTSEVFANQWIFQVHQEGGGVISAATTPSTPTPLVEKWYLFIAWVDTVAETINLRVRDADGTVDVSAGASYAGFPLVDSLDSVVYFNGGGGSGITLSDEMGISPNVLTSDEQDFLFNNGDGRTYEGIIAEALWSGVTLPPVLFGDAVGAIVVPCRTVGWLPFRHWGVTTCWDCAITDECGEVETVEGGIAVSDEDGEVAEEDPPVIPSYDPYSPPIPDPPADPPVDPPADPPAPNPLLENVLECVPVDSECNYVARVRYCIPQSVFDAAGIDFCRPYLQRTRQKAADLGEWLVETVKIPDICTESVAYPSLCAYYRLDEAAGTFAIDQTVSEYHLNSIFTAEADPTGQVNTARSSVADPLLQFTKGLVRLDPERCFSIAQTGGTITGWIKCDDTTPAEGEIGITRVAGVINNLVSFEWSIEAILDAGQANQYGIQFTITTNTGEHVVISDELLIEGGWYFFAAWYDSVNKEVRLRINDTTDFVVATGTPIDLTGDLNLPGFHLLNFAGVFGAESFTGSLDEVGVWERNLTIPEVDEIYSFGNGKQLL